MALHPGGRLTVEGLMSKASFEADGCTLKTWSLYNMYRMGLTALPESLGDLTLSGNLYLFNNRLTTIPESFPNVKGKVLK